MDLLYLFWSISVGIICGVGLYALALTLCAILTIAIWLLAKVRSSIAPGLIIIKASSDCDIKEINKVLKENSKMVTPKSSQVLDSSCELIYEISISDISSLLSKVNTISSVKSVSWIEHNGEMRC